MEEMLKFESTVDLVGYRYWIWRDNIPNRVQMRPLLLIPEIDGSPPERDDILDRASCEFAGWTTNFLISGASLIQSARQCVLEREVLVRIPWNTLRLVDCCVEIENVAPTRVKKSSRENWSEFVSSPGDYAIGLLPMHSEVDTTDLSVNNNYPTYPEIECLPINVIGNGRMVINPEITPSMFCGRHQSPSTTLFRIVAATQFDGGFESGASPPEYVSLRFTFRGTMACGNVRLGAMEAHPIVYERQENVYMNAVFFGSHLVNRTNKLIWNTPTMRYRLILRGGLNFISGYAQNPHYPPPPAPGY